MWIEDINDKAILVRVIGSRLYHSPMPGLGKVFDISSEAESEFAMSFFSSPYHTKAEFSNCYIIH